MCFQICLQIIICLFSSILLWYIFPLLCKLLYFYFGEAFWRLSHTVGAFSLVDHLVFSLTARLTLPCFSTSRNWGRQSKKNPVKFAIAKVQFLTLQCQGLGWCCAFFFERIVSPFLYLASSCDSQIPCFYLESWLSNILTPAGCLCFPNKT